MHSMLAAEMMRPVASKAQSIFSDNMLEIVSNARKQPVGTIELSNKTENELCLILTHW